MGREGLYTTALAYCAKLFFSYALYIIMYICRGLPPAHLGEEVLLKEPRGTGLHARTLLRTGQPPLLADQRGGGVVQQVM